MCTKIRLRIDIALTQVGGNTDLTGAVIASTATPDKNTLRTGTLTYNDIQNRADYLSSSVGVNYNSKLEPGMKLGDLGLTPNMGVPISGDASSTTKSAISPGAIIVGGQKVDPAGLSRDTTNSLNALGKIFDKQTVQERQELAGLFGEIANEEIHKLNLKDGDPLKIALHTVVGSITGQLGGNAFAGGFSAGLNEAFQNALTNITDPAARQWVSFVIGEAAAKVAGGTPQTGGAIAASGTKNNNAAIAVVGIYEVPGLGEAALLATGAIVVGGLVYEAGTWVYDKYQNYVFNKNYPPSSDHSTTTDNSNFKPWGVPNSSTDLVNGEGEVITRRWYDGNGQAYKDVDFTDHGNPKNHPQVPHEHEWDWSSGQPVRN